MTDSDTTTSAHFFDLSGKRAISSIALGRVHREGYDLLTAIRSAVGDWLTGHGVLFNYSLDDYSNSDDVAMLREIEEYIDSKDPGSF